MLLWNVVPTHPHGPGEPSTNRRPTRDEVEARVRSSSCSPRGRRVVAVGRLAQAAHRRPYVRHPSHGGAQAFRDGLAGLLVSERLPIRRNTAPLARHPGLYSAVLQLVVAVATTTLVLVTGVRALLGLGPGDLPHAGGARRASGRARDGPVRPRPRARRRLPPRLVGCVVAAVGYPLGLGSRVVVLGFALVGVAGAVTAPRRAAAADMYPPERRARGISLVLFGAVFGAVLGPSSSARSSPARTSTRDTLVVAVARGGRPSCSSRFVLALRAARPEGDRGAARGPAADAADDRPRRSARSSAGRASSPRCSPPSRASP